MVYELSDMSWVEAEEKLGSTRLAVVPVGATEQHGLHLGLGADWIQSWAIAERVGERIDALVLPVMPYGVSGHHMEFPGTISLSSTTLRMVVLDILESLHRHGVDRVVFINGHGGNLAAITEAAREARERSGVLCAVCQWWDALKGKKALGQTLEVHAGYAETAFTLAARPEAVKMEHASLTPPRQSGGDIRLMKTSIVGFRDGTARVALNTADLSATGSLLYADASKLPGRSEYPEITGEYAEALMEEAVEWICAFIREFEDLELPEIEVSKEAALRELRD